MALQSNTLKQVVKATRTMVISSPVRAARVPIPVVALQNSTLKQGVKATKIQAASSRGQAVRARALVVALLNSTLRQDAKAIRMTVIGNLRLGRARVLPFYF